jgi:hypothetical protein
VHCGIVTPDIITNLGLHKMMADILAFGSQMFSRLWRCMSSQARHRLGQHFLELGLHCQHTSAIALRMAGVGRVTVSLRKSIISLLCTISFPGTDE